MDGATFPILQGCGCDYCLTSLQRSRAAVGKGYPSDPMEAFIALALDGAREPYLADFGGGNPSGLDFSLTNRGVEIEVKRMHSPRIAEQMSRAENVIAAQGEGAVCYLALLITKAGCYDRMMAAKTQL